VAAAVPAGAAHNLDRRVRALTRVIAEKFAYSGDTLTYDDPQNANLMRVIDRRKGLPVALGILYLHAARAQGWRAAGLNFPGHFLIRLDHSGDRAILDPFNRGRRCNAAELRALLKTHAGEEAELRPAYYDTVGDREILLRLQNNIKQRAIDAGRPERAVEVIERMLLFAPGEVALWREAGVCHARIGSLAAASEALERFIAGCDNEEDRHETATLLQRLRTRLN
jgi:regulator of sirC expression with transglutaminase-like and TPR domain